MNFVLGFILGAILGAVIMCFIKGGDDKID